MLAFTAIFLIALISAATAVWLYRLVFNRLGFMQILAGKPGTSTRGRLKAQKGFVSLSRERAKHKTLRNQNGNLKAPWGW